MRKFYDGSNVIFVNNVWHALEGRALGWLNSKFWHDYCFVVLLLDYLLPGLGVIGVGICICNVIDVYCRVHGICSGDKMLSSVRALYT